MPIDHFKANKLKPGMKDWNFNILLNDQPQIADTVNQYSKYIDHKFFYPHIPTKWLHMTVLRAGKESDFTISEMLQVANNLEDKLTGIVLPKFKLEQWHLKAANPKLEITPAEPLQDLFNMAVQALRETVGNQRVPILGEFSPHMTLAYNRDYIEVDGIYNKIASADIDAVDFKIDKVALVRQRATEYYYDWEIIKAIKI